MTSLYDILLLLLLNSFVIFGFHRAVQEGMILSFVKRWGDIAFPEWLQFPMYQCVYCMSSIHSILPFVIISYLYDLPSYTDYLWPYYALALCGMIGLLKRFIIDE